jgi:hypothetical protein
MRNCANGSRRPAAQVRERVSEIISLADQDVLDLVRSLSVEQEVLDILDDPIYINRALG